MRLLVAIRLVLIYMYMYILYTLIIAIVVDQPLYIGREIKANNYTRFNSGGAGYVLNRAAALILHELILSPSGVCLSTAFSSMEDLFVGKCFLEVMM